jgi:hypothetical protein
MRTRNGEYMTDESVNRNDQPTREHRGPATVAVVVLALIAVAAVVTYLGPILKPFLVAVFLYYDAVRRRRHWSDSAFRVAGVPEPLRRLVGGGRRDCSVRLRRGEVIPRRLAAL